VGQGPLEAEIDITAAPAAVWSAVSDLQAMKKRSPELVGMLLFGSPKVGRRGINLNRRKGFLWPTTTRITQWKSPALDNGRGVLAFLVGPQAVTWSYELAPSATGTRVVERRSAMPHPSLIVRLTARWALGGADSHDEELLAGMNHTLARIKADVEG